MTDWQLYGNMVTGTPRSPGFDCNARLIAEHLADRNAQEHWNNSTFIQKVSMLLSRLLKRK